MTTYVIFSGRDGPWYLECSLLDVMFSAWHYSTELRSTHMYWSIHPQLDSSVPGSVCVFVCIHLVGSAVMHVDYLYLSQGAAWGSSNAYAAPSAWSKLEMQCLLMTKKRSGCEVGRTGRIVCVCVLSECEIEGNKGRERRREKNISKVRNSGRP